MVTIELQLVGFALVMTLVHESSVVNIFGVLMPNILHQDSGSIFFQSLRVNKLFEFSYLFLVLIVPEVILIIDSYVESLGIGGII